MAYPSEHYGLCSNGGLRVVLLLVVLFLVGYIVGPQLLSNGSSSSQASCPCDCYCYDEDSALPLPVGYSNSSFADCGKLDPDVREELGKNIVALLSEEISLQKIVANDSLQHTKASEMDARRASTHYLKEAEKCIARMEVCEGARESAEAELAEERKLTEMWEKRALELGWKDKRRVYT